MAKFQWNSHKINSIFLSRNHFIWIGVLKNVCNFPTDTIINQWFGHNIHQSGQEFRQGGLINFVTPGIQLKCIILLQLCCGRAVMIFLH